jgi:hypothetical protein
MKVINISIAVLVIFIGCQRPVPSPDPLRDTIISQLQLYDNMLDRRDSCLVLAYVNSADFDSLLQSANTDTKFVTFTCPYNNFSFSIMRNFKNAGPLLVGQFEVFNMRYVNESNDSGRVVEYRNPGLEILLKSASRDSDSLAKEELRTIITKIYREREQDTLVPVFDAVLTPDSLVAMLPPETYNNLIRRLYKRSLIFTGRYFGIVIFSWEGSGGELRFKEFVIPFRKWRHFQSDVPPDFFCGEN